jgi:hypothetical protein
LETVSTETHPVLGLILTSTIDHYSVPGVGTVCSLSTYSAKTYDSVTTGSQQTTGSLHETSTLSASSLPTSSLRGASPGLFLPNAPSAGARVLGAQALLTRVSAVTSSLLKL